MNKAQKTLIVKYAEAYGESPCLDEHEYKTAFKNFAFEYEKIDPAPDPETYCIWLKDDWNDKSIAGGYSKKEAIKSLWEKAIYLYYASLVEYKKGEYILTLSGARYEIRKEE